MKVDSEPAVAAALRIAAVVIAAVVIVVGIFDESLAYALVVGVAFGVGFAVVGHLFP